MLFQIRTDDGKQDAHSSGTFVFEDGTDLKIGQAGFSLEPLAWWRSPKTGANYPIEWRLEIQALDLELTVTPSLKNQELDAAPFTYWEGAIHADGIRNGQPVSAVGYLEMTGYAGRILGMNQASESE
jgi:predicted secreted hydrolase